MARISKSNIEKEKAELFQSMKKDIVKANLRLANLEKYYGKDSWSSTILKEKLESKKVQALSLSGRININKDMSLDQLRAVNKATQNFLNSRTSTTTGIKKIKKEVIKDFRARYGDYDEHKGKLNKLSLEDAELLYSIFDEKNKKAENLIDKVGSSKMLVIVSDNIKAIREGDLKTKKSIKENFIDDLKKEIDLDNMDRKTATAINKIVNNILNEV